MDTYYRLVAELTGIDLGRAGVLTGVGSPRRDGLDIVVPLIAVDLPPGAPYVRFSRLDQLLDQHPHASDDELSDELRRVVVVDGRVAVQGSADLVIRELSTGHHLAEIAVPAGADAEALMNLADAALVRAGAPRMPWFGEAAIRNVGPNDEDWVRLLSLH